jgi:hypothetical protein
MWKKSSLKFYVETWSWDFQLRIEISQKRVAFSWFSFQCWNSWIDSWEFLVHSRMLQGSQSSIFFSLLIRKMQSILFIEKEIKINTFNVLFFLSFYFVANSDGKCGNVMEFGFIIFISSISHEINHT